LIWDDIGLGQSSDPHRLVLREPRGGQGFGYDPLFIPAGYTETFAELLGTVKNQLSHRARALLGAVDFLRGRAAEAATAG